jgi:protein involved in polysaccharide export with SLBB domain
LLNTLVTRGDVIRLSGAPVKSVPFFFVGGEITSPGQKDFYEGMTLTQAVLVAGGILNDKSTQVKVSRQGPGGLLATTMYDLTQIYQGKIPDPSIQAGDRLEVQK